METRMVTVTAENVEREAFFCMKSKPKSAGYQQKLNWLKDRFTEGLRIKILYEGERSIGFIETIPGEYAWRAVKAPGYLVIHCLWVVGSGKGKGYGTRLLQECLEEASALNYHGVVMVASDRVWLAGKDIFLRNGFKELDQAPPSFQLLVHQFKDTSEPAFPKDWESRCARFGAGLTLVRTGQCPYIEGGSQEVLSVAQEMGLPARVVELESANQVQESSPSAFGVFGIVFNGRLLSYHYLKSSELKQKLDESI